MRSNRSRQKRKNWFRSIQGQLIIASVRVNIVICIISFSFMQKNLSLLNLHIDKTRHINDINRLYGYQQRNYELLVSSMETSQNANDDYVEEFLSNKDAITWLIEVINKEEVNEKAKLRLRVIPYLETSFSNQALALMTRGSDVDNSARYIMYLDTLEFHLKINNYIQEILSINMESNQEYFEDTEQTMTTTRNSLVIIIVAISIFNIIFFTVYNSYLTKPIYALSSKVKSIGQGQWDIDMSDVKGPDEIMELAGKIEIMSENIKSLSQDVKEKAKLELKLVEEELEHVRMLELLREVQLQGIQMQIHPHFLFNTLNVISRMALLEDSPQTYELIIALSKFLRHSLKPMKHRIPLSEEVDMVKQYLYILKSRMGNHLSTRVTVSESTLMVKLPIFTLQPIVENAFKHGIEDNIEGGMIVIDIRRHRDTVRIRICDDGKGMTPDMLSRIREKTQITTVDFTQNEHIGIENVCYRLNQTFGNLISYKVTSSPGKGTVFAIIIRDQEGIESC